MKINLTITKLLFHKNILVFMNKIFDINKLEFGKENYKIS